MKKVFVLAVVLAMAVSAVYAQSVPPLINYQGRLTDAEGKGLAGTKKIEFNIYDAATGGTKIWGPQVFNSVPLINGMFNVIIGSTDTEGRLITDAFNAKERYIGVTVDGKEILPRQQVLSAPFAVQADKAEHAAKATDAEHAAKADVAERASSPTEPNHVATKEYVDNRDVGDCISVNGPCGEYMYMQPLYYLDRIYFTCPDDHPILRGFHFFRCGSTGTSSEGLAVTSTCCKIMNK